MPVTSYSKTLVNPGDTLTFTPVNVGVGQGGPFSFFVMFLTGNFAGATLSISGIGSGSNPVPLTLNMLGPAGPPPGTPYSSPTSPPNGETPVTSPIGPLSPNTIAGYANGYAFSCCTGVWRQIQVQLVSISPLPGGGFESILATVETVSFP